MHSYCVQEFLTRTLTLVFLRNNSNTSIWMLDIHTYTRVHTSAQIWPSLAKKMWFILSKICFCATQQMKDSPFLSFSGTSTLILSSISFNAKSIFSATFKRGYDLFLGVFTKLWRGTVSFIMVLPLKHLCATFHIFV